MHVIRYEPFTLFDQIQNRGLAGSAIGYRGDEAVAAAWVPSVDVKEEAERFVIHADVPGVDPQAIQVSLEDGVLTIQGERKSEARETSDGWTRVERLSGKFLRHFTLPDTAAAEGISAKGVNGVLEIVIPKLAKVQPRKIEVKVN